MTFADNIPEGAGSEIDYPTAFGITFTPIVTGILIGIGGCYWVSMAFSTLSSPPRSATET